MSNGVNHVCAALMLLAGCATQVLSAQNPSDLERAKALDKRISQLPKIPLQRRTAAIRKISSQVLQLPTKYAAPLATNLAIDGGGDTEMEGLQAITSTLAEAVRRLPIGDETETAAFQQLAELVVYAGTRTSLNDSRYLAAIRQLAADDSRRNKSDFTLKDLAGHEWTLKSLRGHVVVLNFWATWCPPCRAEIPALNTVYGRFKTRGLVLLGISEENASTLKQFASENGIMYPVLVDTGEVAKKQFLVPGFPQTYVYNRNGRLVGESIYSIGLQGLIRILAEAGLAGRQ